MAKQKPGLTFERHEQIGAELKVIRQRLLKLSVELTNAYPRSGPAGRVGRELNKALKAVDDARSAAESNLFREHPDRATTKIYYGGRDPDSRRD